MLICKVIGNVWATKKDEALEGKKLMVVQQTDAHGEDSVGESEMPIDAAIVGIIDSLEVDRVTYEF